MKGWITYHLEDRGLLLYLGVELIELTESTDSRTPNMIQQNCEMSEETFKKLEPLWGQFIWGLE
jgi:hypothetical protein